MSSSDLSMSAVRRKLSTYVNRVYRSEFSNTIFYEKHKVSNKKMSKNAQVVDGEASESDSEIEVGKSPDLDVTVNTKSFVIAGEAPESDDGECNVSFRATLEGLIKHTTEISVEKLTRADKTLLNVQESMRATNANLTLARARLKQLHAELEKANCSTALP
ncbi:hypothetical protein HW555_009464, partial [Spodoptera exigua]